MLLNPHKYNLAHTGLLKISNSITNCKNNFPFFYGYVMVCIAILMQVGTSPGQTFGISVFNKHIRESLIISQSVLTGCYLLASLLAAIPLYLLGWLSDKYGLKWCGIGVIFFLGIACLVISQASGTIVLTLGFFLLRTFGQGGLTLVANNTFAMWFHKRVGLVSGLAGVGFAGAVAFIPTCYMILIREFGWRSAYQILGLICWGFLLPVVAIFYRNRPEDVGQHLDGLKKQGSEDNTIVLNETTRSWELFEAWKTRSYWIGLSLTAMWGMIGTGVFFSLVSLFAWKGLSETQATTTFITFALFMAVFQLIGGALADRFPLNILLSVSLLGLFGGVITLWNVRFMWLAHIYAMQFGSAQGLIIAVNNTLWPRYFGRKHLGTIRSTVWTATVAGCSLGPFLMGLSYDFLGGYGPSLGLFSGLLGIGCLLGLFATPPISASIQKTGKG